MALTILDHPLAAHLLASLRDAATPPDEFRGLSRRLTTLLAVEATREMASEHVPVVTPVGPTTGRRLSQPLVLVPILRAGLGMLDPILDLFPAVSVGYIGLERDHETAVASSYYCKLPPCEGRYVLCLDPMLATGGSASQAISRLKAHGASRITMVSVVAAPEGVSRLSADHPDVHVVAAALDEKLNERKYIVPGLGDYGDRLFGTL